MKCIICKNKIVLKEILNHVYAESAILELSPILLQRGYKPIYYFEGSPQLSEGGLIVTIKLTKELSSSDANIIKNIVKNLGFTIEEEGEEN